MRRILSLIIAAAVLSCILAACAVQPVTNPPVDEGNDVSAQADKDTPPTKTVSITLYAQPYYAKNDDGQTALQEIVAAFEDLHPEISITLQELTADEDGEKALSEAVEGGKVDLLFDHAQNAANYARMGNLFNLTDLYTDEALKDLSQGVVDAATQGEMKYIYPIAVSPYLMAFNKELLESMGVLELLPYERTETRTWTAEEYAALLTAIKAKLPEGVDAGVVYAKSSSGDAATRALVTNLYGASFVKSDRSEYTINSEQGKSALEWLNKAVQDELLKVDVEKTSADVVKDFIDGKSVHTILYTIGLANNYASSKKNNFTEILMPYPTQADKELSLEYSLYGLSVFDNGDSDKIAAAQTFIDFAANDRQYSRMAAVMTGGISPAQSKNELRYDKEYLFVETLKPYLGSHVPATEGYDMMKTYWFGALNTALEKDAKVETVLKAFEESANQTIKDAKTKREEALKAATEQESSSK